jgi:hypothetical protein
MGVSGQRHAPAALYPWGKDPRYPLERRLGGPQSWSGHRGQWKNHLLLPEMKPGQVCSRTHYWLSYPSSITWYKMGSIYRTMTNSTIIKIGTHEAMDFLYLLLPFRVNINVNKFLAVSWLRRLVAGLSSRRLGLAPGSVHVGFTVDRVAMGKTILHVLRFSLPILFHCLSSYSCITQGINNKQGRFWPQFRDSFTLWTWTQQQRKGLYIFSDVPKLGFYRHR